MPEALGGRQRAGCSPVPGPALGHTLLAPGSWPPLPDVPSSPPLQAKTKGLHSGVDIGVKYSEKQERNFDDATMKAGQCVIGLQVGVGLSTPGAHWAEGLLQPGPVLPGGPLSLRQPSKTSPAPPPTDGHQQVCQPVGHDSVRHEKASV